VVFELIQADIGTDGLAVIAKSGSNTVDRLAHVKAADYLPNVQGQNPFRAHESCYGGKEEDS